MKDKILIAPDSFKGTLSAVRAAEVIGRVAKAHFPEYEIKLIPLADGGEGSAEVITKILNGEKKSFTVRGPLGGPVAAEIGCTDDLAIIELAQASGITLVSKEKLDPMVADTYGTGQLIRHAIEMGYKKLIICLGGSATVDGGTGMLRALGVKFFDHAGNELLNTADILTKMERIDTTESEQLLEGVSVKCLCDVDVPLTGESGSAYVFGPQKGATEDTVKILDAGLTKFAELINEMFQVNPNKIKGAGAAGGVATAVNVFMNSKMYLGSEEILMMIDFHSLLEETALIVTGEGKLDGQSAYGKLVSGIGQSAAEHGIPVVVLAGALGEDYEKIYCQGFIQAAASCVPRDMSFDEIARNAEKLVEGAADRMFRLIRTGYSLKE